MWLNGFNDNLDGFPKVHCTRFPCPPSHIEQYYGAQNKHVDVGFCQLPSYVGSKYEHEPIGPFGSNGDPGNQSYIINGTCVRDGIYTSNQTLEDHLISTIGLAMLYGYDANGHGQFFWNFRTELEDKWDYQRAVAKGWLPMYKDAPNEGIWQSETGAVAHACTLAGQLPRLDLPDDAPTPVVLKDNGFISYLFTFCTLATVAVLLCLVGRSVFPQFITRPMNNNMLLKLDGNMATYRYDRIPEAENSRVDTV